MGKICLLRRVNLSVRRTTSLAGTTAKSSAFLLRYFNARARISSARPMMAPGFAPTICCEHDRDGSGLHHRAPWSNINTAGSCVTNHRRSLACPERIKQKKSIPNQINRKNGRLIHLRAGGWRRRRSSRCDCIIPPLRAHQGTDCGRGPIRAPHLSISSWCSWRSLAHQRFSAIQHR